MINKGFNNKLYISSVVLLCVLTYLLNCCTAIYQCALIFTTIAITTNVVTSIYDKSRALKGLAFSILVSFTLLWKLPYYIDGKLVNDLVFASLSSVMVSMYWLTSILQILRRKYNFAISNALSLAVAALIDGLIMGVFFVINNGFTYERIIDIFKRELFYKSLYGVVASLIIATAFYIFKNDTKLKIGN